MCKVVQFVNSLFSSNTYLLYKGNEMEVWLVDCGDVEPIIQWCMEQGKFIHGVLLTHTHFDHIYGLNELLHIYPECVVYTTVYGKEALYSDRLNFSRYHETSFVYNSKKVEVINSETTLTLWNEEHISIIETPGHAPDCLTFSIGDYIFTGDSYIPGLKTVTTLRGGNKVLAFKSVELIKKETWNGAILCPGHGKLIL